MDFLLIMGIGTVVAIIIVANLPKSGHARLRGNPFAYKEPPQSLAWQKDNWSMDEMDYLEKSACHDRDPHHWPAPLPPPPLPRKMGQENEYS